VTNPTTTAARDQQNQIALEQPESSKEATQDTKSKPATNPVHPPEYQVVGMGPTTVRINLQPLLDAGLGDPRVNLGQTDNDPLKIDTSAMPRLADGTLDFHFRRYPNQKLPINTLDLALDCDVAMTAELDVRMPLDGAEMMALFDAVDLLSGEQARMDFVTIQHTNLVLFATQPDHGRVRIGRFFIKHRPRKPDWITIIIGDPMSLEAAKVIREIQGRTSLSYPATFGFMNGMVFAWSEGAAKPEITMIAATLKMSITQDINLTVN
jgi:hypothetical protein